MERTERNGCATRHPNPTIRCDLQNSPRNCTMAQLLLRLRNTYRSSLALKPTDAVVTLSVCRSSEPSTLRVAVGFLLLLLLWLLLRLLLGSVLQRGRKISLSCVGRGGRLCSGCGEANGDKSAASCDGVNEFARPRR